MKTEEKKKPVWVFLLSHIGVILLTIFLLFPFAYSIIHPWSHIQCENHYLDLNSGKIKRKKYYWYINYHEELYDTYISEIVGGFDENNAKWVIFITLSISHKNSPHYNYHSAVHQINKFKHFVTNHSLNRKTILSYSNEFLSVMKSSESDENLKHFNLKLEKTLKLIKN